MVVTINLLGSDLLTVFCQCKNALYMYSDLEPFGVEI
jgi:hypothetical protein